MKWLNDERMRFMLVGFVAAIVLSGSEFVKADFTIGELANLGTNINTSDRDGGPNISADGLSLLLYTFIGGWDNPTLRMATREAIEDPWGEAVSLPAPLNIKITDSCISADGLTLYFETNNGEIYVTTRPTVSDSWGQPENLGPSVNSAVGELGSCISADGLELYFGSNRSGGSGDWDVYVATRASVSAPWDTAVNLGPTVNSSDFDGHPCISSDGLTLFISSSRPGGYGDWDIWMSKRATRDDDWGEPVNLGPTINTVAGEGEPSISADGRTLYFSDWMTPRPGGVGEIDLWQASIDPVVDLNGDGIVDAADMCIIVDNWGTDNKLCDIGPMPWGDGIVDVEDLIVLAEHLFEEYPPAEPIE